MAKQNFDWLIGKNALQEAFAAGKILQKVYLGDYLDNQMLKELIKLSRQHKVSVLTVPRTKLDKLCKGNHQGVLAMISPIEFYKVEDLVQSAFESGQNPCFALLDGITDVHNFGAIARSAEVMGITGLIIGSRNSAPVNQEAIKVSAGALLRIPVCKINNPVHTLRELKKMGFVIVGADEKAKMHLQESDLNTSLVIVLGAEDLGISPEVKACLDFSVSIPQAGHINSLNVSVSAGIIFYQWRTGQDLMVKQTNDLKSK